MSAFKQAGSCGMILSCVHVVRFTSVAQQLGQGLEVIFQAVGLLLKILAQIRVRYWREFTGTTAWLSPAIPSMTRLPFLWFEIVLKTLLNGIPGGLAQFHAMGFLHSCFVSTVEVAILGPRFIRTATLTLWHLIHWFATLGAAAVFRLGLDTLCSAPNLITLLLLFGLYAAAHLAENEGRQEGDQQSSHC